MEKVNFYSAAECVFVVSLNPLRILPNLAAVELSRCVQSADLVLGTF